MLNDGRVGGQGHCVAVSADRVGSEDLTSGKSELGVGDLGSAEGRSRRRLLKKRDKYYI
jgi:hypothetical protein